MNMLFINTCQKAYLKVMSIAMASERWRNGGSCWLYLAKECGTL